MLEAKTSKIQLKKETDDNNHHDHQGAATDVPDGEGNTSVHAAVSANCKVTTPKIHWNTEKPLLGFVRQKY